MRTLTKWSVADYQRMRNLGILECRLCKLINGEIWDTAPEGEFHRFIGGFSTQNTISNDIIYPVAFPEVESAVHQLVSIQNDR